ncbi:MAG TPA: matrixin family metalloprotease [Solirubrobacteraceae bacterium]|jgi:hypothetical protein|nr:matrixin family metalloprotease [Solirubrobacteraceae bacterium]
MHSNRKTCPRRHTTRFAVILAAGVCTLGLNGSAASVGVVPVGLVTASSLTTAADAGAPSPTVDPTAAAGDVAQFAAGSPAMNEAEWIAVTYWNAAPCAGVISVGWGSLDPSINATSTWFNPVAAYGNAAANTQCSIVFNTAQAFTWPMFCTVMVHEFGHLDGNQHVTDPTNVMYPVYVAPISPCTGPLPAGVTATGGSDAPAPAASSPPTAHASVHRKHHKRTARKRAKTPAKKG